MGHGPRYRVKPRRQRQGKTDYRQRLKLLKSRQIRLIVRKSLKNIRVQFISYNSLGDKVRVSAISSELVSKYNWQFSTSTIPSAYLTGILAGKRAKNAGIQEAILDIGRFIPASGSKIFASLKGVLDAGIVCSYDGKKLPTDERLKGEHLDKGIAAIVEDIKSRIMGGK